MKHSLRQRLIAASLVIFIMALALTTGACAPPSHEKLVRVAGYGQKVATIITANYSLPDSLADTHVITPEKRDEIKRLLDTAKGHIDAFNRGMAEALAVEHPDFAPLATVVADIIVDVQKLKVSLAHPAYERMLSLIEESLRYVANFFALQVSELRAKARALGMSEAAIGREAARHGLTPERLRAIESYARSTAPA